MDSRLNHTKHASLEWGIKESFRAYFERLPDHSYGLTEGARHGSDGQIEFQAVSSETPRTYGFQGVVELNAHFGALSVRIAHPEVLISDAGNASLTAEVDQEHGQPVRMTIANLQPEDSADAGPQPALRFTATLAEEGQYLFMGNYFAGDSLDPVTIRFTG